MFMDNYMGTVDIKFDVLFGYVIKDHVQVRNNHAHR